jgi:uncharacterized membrane protein YphA (DoxX/SURF4 family)
MGTIDKVIGQGRLIFAIAITDFGIQNLLCAHWSKGDLPVIPWLHPHPVLAYLTGALLLGCGLALLVNFRPRPVALLLAAFFLLCVLAMLLPQAVAAPRDLNIRTAVFEALSMCAGALILARLVPSMSPQPQWLNACLASGRYLLAISMVVFGITHFLVLQFIGSLIPLWIKGNASGGVAWAAFTGAFMIVAGILIAVRWMDRWAAFLLGVMFLLWFLLLHLPRVFKPAGIHSPDEWQSAFIALAMCGICWMVARDSSPAGQMH